MEDFAIAMFKYFSFNEKPKIKISGENFFNPLYLTSENEIIMFFKAKKKEIRLVERDDEEKYIINFLNSIEERRPGGMISLVKIGNRLGLI